MTSWFVINEYRNIKFVENKHLHLSHFSGQFFEKKINFFYFFQILFNLFHTLACSVQQQLIEYAFFMNLTLKCLEEKGESLFFHPHLITQEKTSFQHDLVMVFNKLLDISGEDHLQSAVNSFAKVLLVSPYLTLNSAVIEGMKSVGHSQAICSVSVND